jgi:cytochrome c553
MKTLIAVASIALLGIASPALAAGDAAAGKAKAGPCAACHGANGEGKAGAEGKAANPALAGKTEPAIAQALKDYKSGKRANAAMKMFAAKLSDEDMANLGAYYASLKAK